MEEITSTEAKSYTYQEVYDLTLEYFQGNIFATKVNTDKYALRSNKITFEEPIPDNLHRRCAKELARIESCYPNPLSEEEIYLLLKDFSQIILQGSPMAGIGNPYQIMSLSNCFVIPSVRDSLGSIHNFDQRMSQIFKRRGGVGGDLSFLRPKGMVTHNSSSTTTGLTTWMEQFSETGRRIGQDGRRAAEMLTCSIHHPEAIGFCTIKHDETKVTGANISFRFSDEFMNAVVNNTTYKQVWQGTKNIGTDNYDFENDVSAKEVWDTFIHSNWLRGDPGCLFWDTIIKRSPADCYGKFGFSSVSTNPCSEIILSEFDACRLIFINPLSFVRNPFTPSAFFDFNGFFKVARIGQRLMDDLVDLEIESIDRILDKIHNDPEDEEDKNIELVLWNNIRKSCVNGRRTGLGLSAIGDVIAMLGFKYGDQQSIDFVGELYKQLAMASYTESINMAKERGAFPIYDYDLEKNHEFVNQILEVLPLEVRDQYKLYGRRNIANLTTPPAGSTSNLLLLANIDGKKYFNATSGIEPSFLLEMDRYKKINPSDVNARVDKTDVTGEKWQRFTICHTGLQLWKDVTGKTNIKESPYYGSTANEVDPIKKVDLLSNAIKWVDHSISCTFNLPENTNEETISNLYLYAWKKGLKGVTIYRDNCRQHQVLNATGKQDSINFQEVHAIKRPKDLPCDIHHVHIKGQYWLVFIGLLEDKPYEIFGGCSNLNIEISKDIKKGTIHKTSRGKYDLVLEDRTITDITHTFDSSTNGSHTRLLSTMLRHGIPVQYLVDQLQKDDKDNTLYSFNKVISRVFKKYIKEGTKHTGQSCPSCGSSKLAYQEGCLSCLDCGFSKCS